MRHCGDDHLDADQVVLKARSQRRRKAEADDGGNGRERPRAGGGEDPRREERRAEEREQELAGLLDRVETAESRLGEIDAALCEPGFYENTPPGEVRELREERSRLERRVADLTARWERLAAEQASG